MHVIATLIAITTTAGAIWSVAALDDDSSQFQGQGQKPVVIPSLADQNNFASGGHDKSAGRKSSPFTDAYKKRVEDLLEEWHVPGVAIGVVDGDDVWTEGYGIGTFPDIPVTPQTIFYCASTSKAFTASIIAMMIESGNYTVPSGLPSPPPGSSPSLQLSWDTPIASIIPDDFVLADEWATNHITLEDALSHRTGLPRHDKASTHLVPSEHADGKRTATLRDATRFLRYLPLNAPPRTTFQYCNQMFVVASHVIETLAGGRWMGDVLREWIWEPLGMNGTYLSLDDALAAPKKGQEGHFLASGYSWDPTAQEYTTVPFMPIDEIGGAGGVMSTVDDYTKWLRMWLRQEAPLPVEAHRALRTPRILASPGDAVDTSSLGYDFPLAYALGWFVGSYRGHRFWMHSGGMHAYGAEVFFFPDLEFGFVGLGNTAGTSNAVQLALVYEMVDDRLGVPVDQRLDWTTRYKDYYEKAETAMNESIAKYYPHRPSSPLPSALPIEAYTGTYFHPGYLNFTLQLASGVDDKYMLRDNITLVAIRVDVSWPTINLLEHVSGEYWMMYEYYKDSPQGSIVEYAPAQFEIGPDGRVARMGITWLSVSPGNEDTVEGLVWFDKIV